MIIDIKDFYLEKPMARSKFMRPKLSYLPESLVQQYNMEAKATRDVYVHVHIRQGMYGLPQAGLIARQLLEKRINKQGYQ